MGSLFKMMEDSLLDEPGERNFEECPHLWIDFGDDEDRGVCRGCGGTCDWHWVRDEGSVEDYFFVSNEREVDRWYPPEVKDTDGGTV